MSRNQILDPPRQLRLEFSSNKVGPRFPRAVEREVQGLLEELLIETVRRESEHAMKGNEDERQDP